MAKLAQNSNSSAKLTVGNKLKLNGWLVFDGIALIIMVGVLAVRFTHAGADYTFMKTPQQMTGGTTARSITSGEYRHLSANGIHAEAQASVSAEQMTGSQQVCSAMHVNSGNTFIDIQVNGEYANKFVESAGDATVCVDVNHANQAGEVYAGTSGDANVFSIYGSR